MVFSQCSRSRHQKKARRGAMLILMAFLIPALVTLAAFTINIAYLHLTRTEIMVATDCAARAAGRAFSEYQDVDEAAEAAEVTAALNDVAGSPLRLKTGDNDGEIQFGTTTRDGDDGRFVFTQVSTSSVRDGSEVASAIRVNGYRNSNSDSGRVETIFPPIGISDEFDVSSDAVAMQVDRDISLIVDRSGSMDWKTYAWPSGFTPWDYTVFDAAVDDGILDYWNGGYYYASGQNSESYQDWVWEEYLELGAPPNTPWEDLKLAVDTFLAVLEETHQQEQVALASYSSGATLDVNLTSTYSSITDELDDLYPSGSTAIGYGMQSGMTALVGSLARPYAAKTVVVMTDGVHNYGTDPEEVAEDLVQDYNLTIHTVTFGAGADQNKMQNVADIGGGEHYHADTGQELIDIFEEIANNLPTIVTD